MFEYKELKDISKDDLFKLYDDNGWALYTRDLDSLQRAVQKSLYVNTVWDKDELVALIRVVGDDESVIYIQDILVLEKHHRKGIGSVLVKEALERFKHVRQKTLLTGTEEKTNAFYRSLGFVEPREMECVAFVRHDV